jgi:hypothetical protein
MTLPRRLIGELLGTALLLVAVVARASWANASAAATWPSRCSRTRWRALIRPFESAGIDVGVNFFIASGYGGQTLETLALPGEGEPFERITGFPLRPYVTASLSYRFRHRR